MKIVFEMWVHVTVYSYKLNSSGNRNTNPKLQKKILKSARRAPKKSLYYLFIETLGQPGAPSHSTKKPATAQNRRFKSIQHLEAA